MKTNMSIVVVAIAEKSNFFRFSIHLFTAPVDFLRAYSRGLIWLKTVFLRIKGLKSFLYLFCIQLLLGDDICSLYRYMGFGIVLVTTGSVVCISL